MRVDDAERADRPGTGDADDVGLGHATLLGDHRMSARGAASGAPGNAAHGTRARSGSALGRRRRRSPSRPPTPSIGCARWAIVPIGYRPAPAYGCRPTDGAGPAVPREAMELVVRGRPPLTRRRARLGRLATRAGRPLVALLVACALIVPGAAAATTTWTSNLYVDKGFLLPGPVLHRVHLGRGHAHAQHHRVPPDGRRRLRLAPTRIKRDDDPANKRDMLSILELLAGERHPQGQRGAERIPTAGATP